MRLTDEDQAMLDGEKGPAAAKAMKILAALGKIYGAGQMIPVKSVQVAGVSYANLGEAGLSFLQDWAEDGARVIVPTMLNPAGMDLVAWRGLGIPEEFAVRQQMVIDAYTAMGIQPTCTCTPYLAGEVPARGEHVAWSESSAVSYANSVLGARTNREGGPSALAAAIVGRTPRYGLHLTEKRRADHIVEVTCRLGCAADYGALGYLVGRQVRGGIPYFRFLSDRCGRGLSDERQRRMLRGLGASMAASGAVGLYHVEGITPEAEQESIVVPGARTLLVDDLSEAYAALNDKVEEIDLVSIGCPHASVAAIKEVAELVSGRCLRAALWITTSRETLEAARCLDLVSRIEEAGGRVVADTCLVVSPVRSLNIRALATNSAKMAYYSRSYNDLRVRFGSVERCVQAARIGRWLG